MKPDIWYYKPWLINNNIRYDALFDKNDRQIQNQQENIVKSPLEKIQRLPIKSTMIEVPHN